MNILWGIPTNPAAGVIATIPTTAPIQNPSADGFLPRAASNRIQASPAAAVAVLVVAKAEAPRPLAPRAEPALNPTQPDHSRPVPSKTKGILAGCMHLLIIWSFLRLRISVAASTAETAQILTTVPPAKSSTPS